MAVAVKIALWSLIAFPLWLLRSAALAEAGLPAARPLGAVFAWVAAGLLLAWALPFFGQQLGLPWALAHP